MADTAPAAKADTGGSTFGFLGHKVFGKVPVWVIAVAAVGGYYWYTKFGPGKKSAGAGGVAQGVQGTDPAGNQGTIDPATGFVYGSPEDLAILQGEATSGFGGNNPDGSGGSSGSGGGGGPVDGGPIHVQPPPLVIPKEPPPLPKSKQPGQIQVPRIGSGDRSAQSGSIQVARSSRPATAVKPRTTRGSSGGSNTQWQGLAVSNLISQGVAPDVASTSIQAHLNGQPLSPAMAANTKLAVDSIGPPPQVPAPAQMKAPLTR